MNHVVNAFFSALKERDVDLIIDLYDTGAVLEHGATLCVGRNEIEERIEAITDWIGGADLVYGETNPTTVRWKIVGGPADGANGTETCAVQDGRIVHHHSTFPA